MALFYLILVIVLSIFVGRLTCVFVPPKIEWILSHFLPAQAEEDDDKI